MKTKIVGERPPVTIADCVSVINAFNETRKQDERTGGVVIGEGEMFGMNECADEMIPAFKNASKRLKELLQK